MEPTLPMSVSVSEASAAELLLGRPSASVAESRALVGDWGECSMLRGEPAGPVPLDAPVEDGAAARVLLLLLLLPYPVADAKTRSSPSDPMKDSARVVV